MFRDILDQALEFIEDRFILIRNLVVLLALGSLIAWGLYEKLADPPVTVGPPPEDATRVVILLHGHGASKTDLEPLAEELSQSAPHVSFILPAAPHRVGVGYTWYPSFTTATQAEVAPRLLALREQARNVVTGILRDLLGDGVPARQIFVGGFSQGATVAMDVFLNERQAADIGGIISLSGGALPLDYAPLFERAPRRTFVSHGRSDSVLGSEASRKIVETLEEGGHEVVFIEFDGGHQIDPSVRSALAEFLAKP